MFASSPASVLPRHTGRSKTREMPRATTDIVARFLPCAAHAMYSDIQRSDTAAGMQQRAQTGVHAATRRFSSEAEFRVFLLRRIIVPRPDMAPCLHDEPERRATYARRHAMSRWRESAQSDVGAIFARPSLSSPRQRRFASGERFPLLHGVVSAASPERHIPLLFPLFSAMLV